MDSFSIYLRTSHNLIYGNFLQQTLRVLGSIQSKKKGSTTHVLSGRQFANLGRLVALQDYSWITPDNVQNFSNLSSLLP